MSLSDMFNFSLGMLHNFIFHLVAVERDAVFRINVLRASAPNDRARSLLKVSPSISEEDVRVLHVIIYDGEEVCKRLGVNIVKRNSGRNISELTWQNILDEINPRIKALPRKTLVQKRKFEKFSAAQSYLYAVKDAWRNPIMHPRASGYNDTQTNDILNQVRAFMHELAGIIATKRA
jgi:hypothetical protein